MGRGNVVTIRLPRDQQVQFRAWCCMRPGPLLRHRICERAFGLGDLLSPFSWPFREPYRCEVPICAHCQPQLRRWRWLQALVLIGCAAALFATMQPWLQQWKVLRPLQEILVVAVLCVLLTPFFVWCQLRPLPLELEVDARHVSFRFRSVEYAQCFRDANPQAKGSEPTGWVRPPA